MRSNELATAFQRWKDVTTESRHKRQVCMQAVLLHAFDLSPHCGSVEKLQLCNMPTDSLLNAHFSNDLLQIRGLCVQIIERVVLRLAQLSMYHAFNAWKDMARRKITAARIILRWRQRELVAAWKRCEYACS